MSRDAWTANFDELDPLRYYSSIVSLSIGMRALMWPLGVVKTRTQFERTTAQVSAESRGSSKSLQGRSTISVAKEIYQKEGLRKLYLGFGLSAVTGLFSAPLFLTVMERSRQVYIEDFHFEPAVASALAATTGSILGQLAIVPSENISQRVMVDPRAAAREGVQVQSTAWLQAKSIWATKGLQGFYRGFMVSMMTYTPTSTMFWYLYSNMRCLLATPAVEDKRSARGASASVVARWVPRIISENDMVLTPLCSSVAGALAMTLTSPLDVLKTRSQIRAITARQACRELIKEEGARGFLRGGVQRIGMGSVMYSAFLSSYEGIKWFSKKERIE